MKTAPFDPLDASKVYAEKNKSKSLSHTHVQTQKCAQT